MSERQFGIEPDGALEKLNAFFVGVRHDAELEQRLGKRRIQVERFADIGLG